MSIEQIGYVVASHNGTITVRVQRESACGGNCVSCKGCPSDAILVTGFDDINTPYEIGEEVLVQMPEKFLFQGTLGSYGLMTLFMLLGGILGFLSFRTELVSVLGAIIGLSIGILLMKFLFRNHEENLKITRRKR